MLRFSYSVNFSFLDLEKDKSILANYHTELV